MKILPLLLLSATLLCQILRAEKSAEQFVTLLETHDYWYRSYPDSTDELVRPNLYELAELNAHYLPVTGYTKINMDYRYPVPDEEPFHDFTILELEFESPEFVHMHDSTTQLTLFPNCAGTYNIAESDMAYIFPLWDYEELIPDMVEWEYREYIDWYAFRFDLKVFVIYTISTTYTGRYKKYAERLHHYLILDQDHEEQEFIDQLETSKKSAKVAYDAIPALQKFLLSCGLNPGELDGRYGSDTELALLELLKEINYVDDSLVNTALSSNHVIGIALKKYQKENDLPISGRCDLETIEALKTSWSSRQ